MQPENTDNKKDLITDQINLLKTQTLLLFKFTVYLMLL